MKKLFVLILSALLLLSLAACKEEPAQTTGNAAAQPTYAASENPVTYFSMSLNKSKEDTCYITVVANDDGTANVMYEGKESKSDTYDASFFHGLTNALNQTGLSALNGQDILQEGEPSGSMCIEFYDGTIWMVSLNGAIPDAFAQGFAAMETFIKDALSNPQNTAE